MVIVRYLNRLVLLRIAVAVIAISLFALLFDLLDASDDLVRGDSSTSLAFARYFVLRFPSLFAEILPFAALLGALFAAADLMRNGELTIFWASGISPLGIVLRLLPVGLLVLGLKLANDDLLVPPSVQQLRDWQVGAFKGGLEGFAGEHMWMQRGQSFIRLPRLGPDETEADGILIIKLDELGNIQERITAEHVLLRPNRWLLTGVTQSRVGRGQVFSGPSYVFENTIDLDRLRVVARPPQEVALLDLIDIIGHDGYGVADIQTHRTALLHRIFGAFQPMLLVLLTFAFARRVTRQAGVAGLFMKGIGTGFSFVILSGLTLALAEAGFIGPLIATAGPVLLLAALVVLLPLKDEHMRRIRRRAA